jgi:hypothetical protein
VEESGDGDSPRLRADGAERKCVGEGAGVHVLKPMAEGAGAHVWWLGCGASNEAAARTHEAAAVDLTALGICSCYN